MIMLRVGRFRHRLLDDPFLKENSKLVSECLQPFLKKWRAGELHSAEMAAIYIFIFSFLRRPQDFLGGQHNEFSTLSGSLGGISGAEVLHLLQSHLPEPLKSKKSLDRLATEASFLPSFCALSWRSIPLSVARSLWAWRQERYRLELLITVPTPQEVLILQSQGQRCISMLVEENEISSFVEEGRDVLGFIVHDLIHADHFFSDPDKASAQILFCQKLLTVHELPIIQAMLQKDPVFEAEFHYLMSDMNSVPLHLLKTLKAVLLGHFKRKASVSLKEALPFKDEKEFIQIYRHCLAPWEFDADAWEAALRLNSSHYKGREDSLLLDVALNKL